MPSAYTDLTIIGTCYYKIQLLILKGEEAKANPNLPSCTVEEIENCQIHTGWKKIVEIRDADDIENVSGIGTETLCLIYTFELRGDESPKFSWIVEFGPDADRTADHLDPTEYRVSDIAYVRFSTFVCDGRPIDN